MDTELQFGMMENVLKMDNVNARKATELCT